MARNFLLARFIDDRGGRGGRGGDGGGGGPAEWRIHRASRQRAILDEEKEHEEGEGGGQKRICVEGTRFLNSFVRNRYPVPKSASLRDICTHKGRKEREKGRQSDSREYMQNGGLKRGEKKSEEKRRGREVETIDTRNFLNEIGKELFYFRSLDR